MRAGGTRCFRRAPTIFYPCGTSLRLGFFGESIGLGRREKDTMGGSLLPTSTKTGEGMSSKNTRVLAPEKGEKILSMEEIIDVSSLSRTPSLHL